MINTILICITAIILIAQALIGLSFFITCLWEKEQRASMFAGFQFGGMLAMVILFFLVQSHGFWRTPTGAGFLVVIIITDFVTVSFLSKRSRVNPRALKGSKGLIVGEVKRHDEREIVFARNRSLRPGSEEYRRFYQKRPEWENDDAKRRQKGGPLGHPGSIDNPHGHSNVAVTLASLSIPLALSNPHQFQPQAHPEMKGKKICLTPGEATERVKGCAIHLGADLVGVTQLNPLWIYSKRGEIFHENWKDWGKEIPVEHPFAVVFATEMSFQMVGTAPHTPTMIESMRNYAKGAYIATQLAAYITNLGYSATANHLRHYDAILVPPAVDAGLGELGRLGYLITKEFGPRVRLGTVSTNLPLIPDKPVDIGVEDFCKICKKCAVCCPSHSIPMESQAELNGTLRWKLNAETCFDYWGKVGTDCNVCMRVCPWSHAKTFPHRLIVKLVSRNRVARRLFVLMDDIFYGKKPRPKPAPKWVQFNG